RRPLPLVLGHLHAASNREQGTKDEGQGTKDMLEFFTVVIMGILAYAYLVEGLFTACVMCVNVIVAGLIAFNFWEPLANVLEPIFGGYGYEDFLCLILLFSVTLGAMRTITGLLCPTEVAFPPQLQRPGGALFGLLTGYLVSGFLACALQTLPWHQKFMYFEAKADSSQTIRSFLPPDRVWLAAMHRVGAGPLSRGGPTFDEKGTFSLRYFRHRRHSDTSDRLPHRGEFDPSPPSAPAAPAVPASP